MSHESLKAPLEDIAALLVTHGVEFLVIGGQAEFLFGSARPTQDVDICYKRDQQNFVNLAACLKQMQARLRGAPHDIPFILDARTLEMGNNFTFETVFGDLDILGFVEPIGGYEQLLEGKEEYQFGTMRLGTIGLDDLLKVKLYINRAKDQESILQLKAIKRIRQENQ
ncbi:MAG TPA: hypothetical protein VGN88_12025 [Phycisphaerae bacterium]